ncbi:formylglycine-generating enzyme family protein [Neisseria zalophi]|uniref:Formylglycine-generating enzyme family protein n=1 Tax=Neisseria zalophi TaxID=640030 RepID=A0A5J6PV07_9NEIS|nr:formylglycine-generating enzyme family protein [Neisseria zalophi]QEY26074.1 formylglycine-generating enzyme family protein [Neisseria zalophi]
MNTAKLKLLWTVLMMVAGTAAADMVTIKGGSYRPLYLKKDTPLISVKPFQMDTLPVTNAEFAAFVQKYPQWQRGNVSSKQTEKGYLRHWVKNKTGYKPKAVDLKKPVTNVSWFAANAYCSAQGKRLPTIDQWEFVGQASATRINGTTEKNYNRTILDWYAEGNRQGLRDVGQGKPNYWGVYDMHGLIWEWTEDFNSSQLTSSAAEGSNLFCSGASAGSADPSDYAAFMRYGIRTSLQAKFVLNNLGFRCVR